MPRQILFLPPTEAGSASFRPVAPATSLTGGPGDLVKVILEKLGIKPTVNCGCGAMRQRMNEWGYSGCWLHRREIAEWFEMKATEAVIEFTPAKVLNYVVGKIGNNLTGCAGIADTDE